MVNSRPSFQVLHLHLHFLLSAVPLLSSSLPHVLIYFLLLCICHPKSLLSPFSTFIRALLHPGLMHMTELAPAP